MFALLSLAAAIYPYTRSSRAYAATNNYINFQARILHSNGAVIADGSYSVAFNLYNVSSGGTSEWTETQTVTVKNGYITANLGSVTAFPNTIDWSQQQWLTLNVNSDGEMNPRMAVTAVPYAFRSAEAAQIKTYNGANSSTLSIAAPTGGNQTFQLHDQGAAGTYNLALLNGGSQTFSNANTFSAAGLALQVTNNASIGGTLAVTGLTTATGGITTGSGSTFTNGGATINSTLAIGDLPTGGNIGTAAATVDIYTNFTVAQTTAGQTLTIPAPTTTTTGRVIFITNVGTAGYTLGGSIDSPGTTMMFVWNSTTSAWTLVSSGTSGNYIQNGTAVQTANFNVQSYNVNNVTATIQGANSQIANILEVKQAGVGTPVFSISAAGDGTFDKNLSVNGNATLGNASGDVLTINGYNLSAPNGLSIASDSLVVDAGSVGIGVAPVVGEKLHVEGSDRTYLINAINNSTNTFGTLLTGVTIAQTATGNSNNSLQGVQSNNTNNGTSTISDVTGYQSYITNNSTGQITNAYGLSSIIANTTTGQISNVYGGYFNVLNYTTGTIGNIYELYLKTPVNSSGTVNNNYGLYIEDQSAVGSTNSYNIYSAGGTAKNYFAGYLQSGTSVQTPLLDTATATALNIGTTNATGINLNKSTTVSGNLTVANTGYLATQKGTDYSTTGTGNDVNFGAGSLYRLTGASAQTITGIAGGADGRYITIVNAGSNTATISNNNAGSAAANRITTGTGADISLPAGASVSLIYDAGASLWRVTSGAAAAGGAGVNIVGAVGSPTANGATITGTTLNLAVADGTNPGLVSTGAQTFGGAKSFSYVGIGGTSTSTYNLEVTGTTLLGQANSISALAVKDAGANTIFQVDTQNANVYTTGNLIQSGGSASLNDSSNFNTKINTGTSTGTVSIGNSLAGNISLQSGGTISLAGTTNINTANTAATTIGNSTGTLALLGGNSTSLAVGTGANTTTLNFTAPSGTNTQTFQANSGVVALGTAANSLFFTTTGATNVTLPTSGTLCTTTTCATGGTGSYIQNQNAIQQTASNFWISGTGRADTSFTTPLLDTPSATALNIGTTNATQINLNQNTQITGNLSFGAGADRTINVLTQTTANTAGNNLNLLGATGNGTGAGGNINITGGAGGTTNANGGNVVLSGGANTGTGSPGVVLVKPQVDTTNAFVVQSAASTLSLLKVDTTNGRIVMGTNSSAASRLYVVTTAGDSGIRVDSTSSGSLLDLRRSSSPVFTVDSSGNTAINAAASINPVSGNGTDATTTFSVVGQTGGNTTGTTGQVAGMGGGILLQGGTGGTAATGSTNGNGGSITLSAGAPGAGTGTNGTAGSVIVKNQANSATAFQVQNFAGSPLLTVDTSGSNIITTSNIYVNDATNASTLLYIDNNSGVARYQNRVDGLNTFQVRDSGGTAIINVDSSNDRLGVLNTTPGYPLDVGGDINTTTSYRINGTQICTSSGCTPASGSSYYIQAQATTPGTAQNTNFNIGTGTGIAATLQGTASIITPSLTSNGALTVTSSVAGNISITTDTTGVLSLDTGTTGAINIGTNANGKTVTIGNTTNNSVLNLQAGGATGGINFKVATGTPMTIDSNGRFVFQPNVNTSDSFKVNNASGAQTILSVSSSDLAVGVTGNLGINMGSLTGLPAAFTVNGAIRVVNSSDTYTTYTTPLGATIAAKLAFDNVNPSAGNQALALGIGATSNINSRAILVADARATTNNQPAISVLSPDENNVFGLGWDGSSTTAKLKAADQLVNNTNGINVGVYGGTAKGNTIGGTVILQGGAADASAGSTGGSVQIAGANGSSVTTGGWGGSVSINAGNAAGTGNNNGGNITLQAGTATGTGTVGTISLTGTTSVTGTTTINTTGTAATSIGNGTGTLALQGGNSSSIVIGTAGNTTTLNFTAPSGANTITFPAETGTVCTTAASAACLSAYGAGGGNYVNLQAGTPGTADTGNFNISGTGIANILQAGTKVMTSLLDTQTVGGTLNIGLTSGGNTNLIYLNASTTVAYPATFTVEQGLSTFGGGVTFINTAETTFTTPLGTGIAAKVAIQPYAIGDFNQALALGLTSASGANARGLTIADARTTTNNQPAIAVLSPDENQIFGFGWDGSNTQANFKATSGIDIGFKSGTTLTALFKGATATVQVAGNIDTITNTTLALGTSTATAVSIGKAGITTTNNGALTVAQLLTGQLGATISGAAISLNDSSNFNTTINTGTSTGAVSIGNASAGNIALQSGGTISLTGTTSVTGTTIINTTGTAATSIGNGTGTLALQGGNSSSIVIGTGANTTTLNFTAPGGTNTITFPAVTGTVCLTSQNCSTAGSGYILNQSATPGTAQTGNFNVTGTGIAATLQGSTSVLTPLLDAATAATALNIGTTNANQINLNQNTQITGNLSFAVGANRTISVNTQATANTAGNNLTLQAATGNGTGAGGSLTLQGGAGGATGAGGNVFLTGGNAGGGNNNGGGITLSGGTGAGTGVIGLVNLAPTTFSAGVTQNFGTSGNITGVDTYSTIPVNATATGLTITLPAPAASTQVVGRIVYVTAVNGSNDFALLLAGTSVSISMKANSTATLIWNGTGWTAAGASSSTTLQAAYNNTLTSAGGAELVLNAPGGAADGLTIRNNATPITGALLEVQTSVGSNLFSVNNNATEYATNGGAETQGASSTTFPASTWSAAPAGGTVTRENAAQNYIATGQASVKIVTAATAGQGAANTLSSALTANLSYTVSFTEKGASFSTLDVYYSPDGTNTSPVVCATSQTATASIWTRINCTFTVPASGITAANAIFIRQSDATARTFYIDNLSVTVNANVNHAADGSVDDSGNFTTNWTAAPAGGTITQSLTTIYDTSASAQVVTAATAGQGIRNNLAIAPKVNTQYLVTLYALSSNTFNDLTISYSRDGGTSTVPCADYNTQSVSTTSWTKITCLFTTDGTAPTNQDLIISQNSAVARTFWVDALSITLNSNTASNVQIGGGNEGGPVTLFTLDRSAGAPIAANNTAYLGSMYYDTTTGRIQCYEQDGWGACGAAPDNIVNLTPEYAGAVLNGSGVGTMTTDFCSNQTGVLSVNSTLCGAGQAFNYYRWTSPQATQQTYSIYVTYQLPSTFKSFANDDTVQLTARVDSTSNAAVTYQMFRSEGGSITQCGTGETTVTTIAGTWQTLGINGNEASGCGFSTSSANAFVIFKINVKANSNANAYVGNLSFTTTGK